MDTSLASEMDVITNDINRVIVQHQSHLLNNILETYPGLVDRRDINERTWMHQAAEVGSWGCMEVLLKCGLDVNSVDVMGDTPLHRAATRQRAEATTWLLENNADCNAKNFYGVTPTLLAASWRTDILEEMLEKGADPNVTDKLGQGVGEWASMGVKKTIQVAQAKAMSKPKP